MLMVGAIDGLIAVALTLSFVTLVYSGEAASYLSTGAALFLLGAAAMNFVAARGTSLKGAILVPQDSTSAVVAVTLAALLPGVAVAERLGTLFTFTLIATASAGALMLALGVFRLGNLVRFVPYPVIGGFLAGTGWLLVVGAADLVTVGFQWSGPAVAALIGASIFAVAMVVVLKRRAGMGVFPGVVVAGIAVFYIVLAITGTSIDEARSLGLLPVFTSARFELSLAVLTAVDWSSIWTGIGGLLTVPLIGTLALLLNVTGLELVGDSDADLNRELRAVGGANLVASLTGTPAGYHALGVTALGYRVGVFNRGVTLICAGICLLAALGGASLISLLPTPLVGGLLLMIGLGFLTDWLVDGRRQMTGPEYLLMLALVAAVAFFGFLAAVLMGMAASVALFAVAYSRVDPVRHVSSAAERHSALDRSPAERDAIAARSGSIVIFELQAYLFFGTARALVDRVQLLVDDTPGLTCLVIDLRRVEGVDSTGLASFIRLLRLAGRSGLHLILSDLPDHLTRALERAAVGTGIEMTIAANLDSAIEMAEDHLLADQEIVANLSSLAEVFGEDLWARIEPHLSRVEIGAGASLVDLGEGSVGLFLIDRGRIAAEIPTGDGRWQRVVSSGPGTILGEMSLYLGAGRTARLRAEEDSCVFALDGAAIAALDTADPKSAAELHRRLAGVLATRLSASNDTVRSLLR